MIGLGQSLGKITHGVVDESDMYRAGLVQAVAALDHYVHGVVLDRAVDILMGRTSPAGKTSRIGLHFDAVQELLNAGTLVDRESIARTHVAARLSVETFQRADSIAAALAMVGIKSVWKTAFPGDPSSAMTALNLIVDRRNRIVHQGDSDPLSPGSVTPLLHADSSDAIDTIERTALAIDPLC
jgi:hypothetical protein